MVSSGRINLEELSKKWGFFPGQDSGIAHIYLPTVDRTFRYTGIRSTGSRAWTFEGASLNINLRPDGSLAVQYPDTGGAVKTLLFTALAAEVDDLVVQETERRNALFRNLYDQGPVFKSANYGTLSFLEEGKFTWTDYDLLSPGIIPEPVLGGGSVSMDLFLSPSLTDRYDGAFTLRFNGIGRAGAAVHFMYTLDSQGFRLEYTPEKNVDNAVVFRRDTSPMVIYFSKTEPQPAVLTPTLEMPEF
jgi:hypothetical protein